MPCFLCSFAEFVYDHQNITTISACTVGDTLHRYSGSVPFGWSIANALVFKNVRKALGLDRCRYCFTGAAPVMKDTLDYFLSLDIPLLDLYGMSESSGQYLSLRHAE